MAMAVLQTNICW